MRTTNRQIDWLSIRSITSVQLFRTFVSRLLLIVAIPILLGTLLQSCGSSSSPAAPVTNLKSITIDPVDSSIAVGTKVQLHATGTYKNETTKDITDLVTWESADETVATVSNAASTKGLAGGSAVGATTISAKLHGVKGVSTFTVTNASLKSITVEPVNPLVSKGTTVQMAAQGNFSDGSVQDLTTQVTWSSGNSSIAQVSNTADSIGLVTGVSAGSTPITAALGGIQDSTTVTVSAATLTSITITPDPSIARGTTIQETATCEFSDGITEDCTNEVSWTSSNSGIAQVSDTEPTKGLVTGVTDLPRCLAEIARCLAAGGTFIIAVGELGVRERLKTLLGDTRWSVFRAELPRPRDVRIRRSFADYRDAAQRAGLNVDLQTVEFIATWADLAEFYRVRWLPLYESSAQVSLAGVLDELVSERGNESFQMNESLLFCQRAGRTTAPG
jgi:hypothetical protein